jgi:hypothetical protein
MRTDFFVASFLLAAGERFVILVPASIPASFFFASSMEEKLRHLTLLPEEDSRRQLSEMGLSSDEAIPGGMGARPSSVGEVVGCLPSR